MTKKRRAMRADAVRNRELILSAAEQVLGQDGPNMSTESVAALAGVGIGTVFRHFPTKELLLRSVVLHRAERLTHRAGALLEKDPGEAVFVFIEDVVEHTASTPSILHALTAMGVDATEELRTARAEFMRVLDELVQRAQSHGALRRDIDVEDVFSLLVAIVHATRASDSRAPVVVVLDGLRIPD